MKAHTFLVTGRVQGVGFRWSAQEEARALGLGGWVRNEDSGAVSGYVQGEAAAVDEFILWLSQGPRGAVVKNVTIQATEVQGYRLFTIRD